MYNLALWLEVGRGLPAPDEAQAVSWLRQAAEGGHPLARRELRRILDRRPDLE